MGESVTFECGVEAADVSGVDVWWRKDSLNLTVGENTTNVNRKYDIQVRYLKRNVSGGDVLTKSACRREQQQEIPYDIQVRYWKCKVSGG